MGIVRVSAWENNTVVHVTIVQFEVFATVLIHADCILDLVLTSAESGQP